MPGWLEYPQPHRTGYEIKADADHFVIVLNGKTLLEARDSKHASGVIGFQCQKDNRIEFRGIKLLPIKN